MTVYYYDLFTGTAGTLLTSHTADSGATWPNDADHYTSTVPSSRLMEWGGLSSNRAFEPPWRFLRPRSHAVKTLKSYSHSSVKRLFPGQMLVTIFLIDRPRSPALRNVLRICLQRGVRIHISYILDHRLVRTCFSPDPTLGPHWLTWYMKVDVSTSGGNTTLRSYYSTTSAGPWTTLITYSAATSSDLVAVELTVL